MNIDKNFLSELVTKALKGNRKAIAKIITLIECDPYIAIRYEDILFASHHEFIVIGVSGAPGVGKSSIINLLIKELRNEGSKVAVIAIDPSSIISGGSLLGDRVRIRYSDEGTFFRSISTIPESDVPWKACPIIEFLGSIGYDYVIVEHPGAGQVDIRIHDISDILIIVLQPLTGDEIQMLKAGLLELGDIYVINKYDLPQAELFYNIVASIMSDKTKPPIIKVSTISGFGIKDLVNTITEIKEKLIRTGVIRRKRLRRKLACIKNAILNDLKFKLNELVSIVEGELKSSEQGDVGLHELYNKILILLRNSICSN